MFECIESNMTKLNVIPVIDGMVSQGFCECEQKLTTACDHKKNPRCFYAKGQQGIVKFNHQD